MFKKTSKIIGKIILSIIGLMVSYLIIAVVLSKIVVEKEPSQNKEVTIYVITNGVHTDVVVPVKNELFDWSKEVKYENAVSVDSTYNYLGMGWGDTEIYIDMPTWSDLTVGTAFRAASGLSPTAIHATFYKNMIENDTCFKIEISKNQYGRLVNYITDSFKKDIDGHFINIKTNANYGKTDAFYHAKGNYSIFRTCNTWTNSALKASGLKACLWTPFDKAIFALYK